MANLLKPEKRLRFSEKHFQGYWVQLNTLIRQNENADEVLDGILLNPMLRIIEIRIPGQNPVYGDYGFTEAVRLLYAAQNLGDPPGSYPTEQQLEDDPVGCIKDFARATKAGTTGGLNPATGNNWAAARAWARRMHQQNLVFRTAVKHIWEVIVSTLSASQAVTVIAGLPYGSGPNLLVQVKNMQQRQTTMALFTLFSQLISMQLRTGEHVAGLYGRILDIRARLENWDPPITLPDKLLIVCMIRLLPRQFHGVRTIIMSKETVTLKGSKDMLLDAENQDAARVAAAVGSKTEGKAPSLGTALITDAEPKKRKKQKKKRPAAKDDPKKSAKYHSEGPCTLHGKKCAHSSTECWTLHPELKGSGTGAVANPGTALTIYTGRSDEGAGAYGFMNEDWGYALMLFGSEEVNTACQSVVIVCNEKNDVDALMATSISPNTQGITRSPFVHATTVPGAEMPCVRKGRLASTVRPVHRHVAHPLSTHDTHADFDKTVALVVHDETSKVDAYTVKTMRPYSQGIFGSPSVLATAVPGAEMPCVRKGGLTGTIRPVNGLVAHPLSTRESNHDMTNAASRAQLGGLQEECADRKSVV